MVKNQSLGKREFQQLMIEKLSKEFKENTYSDFAVYEFFFLKVSRQLLELLREFKEEIDINKKREIRSLIELVSRDENLGKAFSRMSNKEIIDEIKRLTI